MMYDVHGNPLSVAYDVQGHSISPVYDVHGNPLGTPLKLMTYNVGQWYIGRTTNVPVAEKQVFFNLHNGTFERCNADVLFLQEALSTWCSDGSKTSDLLAPYFDNSVSWRTDTNYQGHYICTKGYPMRDVTVHPFTKNKGNYPAFESAVIDVGGKAVRIVNTHSDYALDPYQIADVTDILAVLENFEYFILMGDFNHVIVYGEEETSTSVSMWNNGVKRFLDAGYNVGNLVMEWLPTFCNDTTYASGVQTGGLKYCDNIVTSANISIDSIYCDNTKFTNPTGDRIDHIPLIAEVTIY